jgi:hypothetical protein
MKFLISPKKRKLLRLQASNSLIEVQEHEHKALKKPVLIKSLQELLRE